MSIFFFQESDITFIKKKKVIIRFYTSHIRIDGTICPDIINLYRTTFLHACGIDSISSMRVMLYTPLKEPVNLTPFEDSIITPDFLNSLKDKNEIYISTTHFIFDIRFLRDDWIPLEGEGDVIELDDKRIERFAKRFRGIYV